MSFNNYINTENLSLEVVEDHINYMTNDNYTADKVIDIDKLTNNIKIGFVIITQLNCYFESFINTIINYCIGCDKDSILKRSIEEKLDIICVYYKKELSNVKSRDEWEKYKIATRVRNEMIHFKRTYIGEGVGIPIFKIGGQVVSDYFTKDNMNLIKEKHIALTKNIADTFGLDINTDKTIFSCDAKDGLANYVYDKKVRHL